ncbi:sarcalumenin-like isoform X2 [Haliotis rufescens]|uniref:sarcalumenin-like isoform X2 n=1 Tax=Haliotis rufescens TaxID=6454 RepID=UPI001EB08524|nr:sarcalumenin-like isoform X2 [Haliotis rufescens]
MAASTCHIVNRCLLLLVVRASLEGILADEKPVDIVPKERPPVVSVDDTNFKEALTGSREDPNKSHGHIDKILQLDKPITSSTVQDTKVKDTLQALLKIYNDDVKPLEDAYRFSDLNRDAISEGEIFAKPLVLFLGPWSVGKSTMINYLLSMEGSHQRLHTGAEPTTSDFTVLLDGPHYRTIKGMELVTDKTNHFSPLQKFGLGFTERLQGKQFPSKLLQKVSIVDTPGIIENKKQQQRGYPFNEVCQWFIDRADIIFLVFDPTKLDVGSELSILFKQVKGHEAKIRLILNKADTVSAQELMRVYGALFWSLAPLVNVVEPPRVYVGTFWTNVKTDHSMAQLFYDEELALLHDLNQVMQNQIENKVSFIRRHAFYVRLHALIIDRYIGVFNENNWWKFSRNEELFKKIITDPDNYNLFKSILSNKDISRHDLPSASEYMEFFSINSLDLFKPLSAYCPWTPMYTCDMVKLEAAINTKLPQLLASLKPAPGTCTKDTCTKKKP